MQSVSNHVPALLALSCLRVGICGIDGARSALASLSSTIAVVSITFVSITIMTIVFRAVLMPAVPRMVAVRPPLKTRHVVMRAAVPGMRREMMPAARAAGRRISVVPMMAASMHYVVAVAIVAATVGELLVAMMTPGIVLISARSIAPVRSAMMPMVRGHLRAAMSAPVMGEARLPAAVMPMPSGKLRALMSARRPGKVPAMPIAAPPPAGELIIVATRSKLRTPSAARTTAEGRTSTRMMRGVPRAGWPGCGPRGPPG